MDTHLSFGMTLLLAGFSGIAMWPEEPVAKEGRPAPKVVAVADVELVARDLARAVLWLGDGPLPVGERYETTLAQMTAGQRAALWRLVDLHGEALGSAFTSEGVPALRAAEPATVRFVWSGDLAKAARGNWSVTAPVCTLASAEDGAGVAHVRAEWRKADGAGAVVSLGSR